MPEKYDHKEIEKKWRDAWEKEQSFRAEDSSKKPKKYVLIEFPYPSGEGLHMGHLRPYTAGDTYSRYWRMKGYEVLYPIGWDAFGLPAENYAIKNKVHPRVSTAKNIENAKRQLKSWGMGFDWSREINTTDPAYYKWTQWIFLQFFKAGLAYEATGLINWCPKDKTGLANEEVIDGKCERCGTVVEKKELRQWYLKITSYAEKLLEGLKTLKEWPEPVKLQQENWIGKSEGAEIEFPIKNNESRIKKFILIPDRGGSPERNFIPSLKAKLQESGYQVEAPFMPNPGEPNDLEQSEFIIKNFKPDESTAVVGHSFGGVVALRILESGVKLGKVLLVGTPYSGKFLDGKVRASVSEAVKKGFDFEKIKKNCKNFAAIYDTHDYVVPISDGESFAEKLNINLVKTKAEQPHFTAPKEPVLLTIILDRIIVFTTRPDTLYGATYMVLAPEHPLVEKITTREQNNYVIDYVIKAKAKTDIERSVLEKEKTGVELKGIKAINPATKEEIPVWVADYVLMGYGTGAIMAVPAHDERDFEFAKKYQLPIKHVVFVGKTESKIYSKIDEALEKYPMDSKDQISKLYSKYGILYNSGEFTGLTSEEAIPKIGKKFGKLKTQYKLRDWVFSRQRYWGEPIPLVHCPDCGIVAVPEKDLPVELPEVKDYEPTGTGESPLVAIDSWVNVKCPNCKGPAKRETNTMPQWAGSSWYWLRYTDPKDEKEMASKKLLKHWTPVDVYFGGMEHTTLHLLYSRFWNLFLYDQGHVTAKEPYSKRVPHGIVLSSDGEKMSKSRGNVVNPDVIVEKFGADALRMYEMFLGPHGDTVSWNDQGILGVVRFLDKVWKHEQALGHPELVSGSNSNIHKLIKKITEDVEAFKFNTAISAFMEFLNKNDRMDKNDWENFLKLLAPFAPHITEELWHQLGHEDSIHKQPWPEYDAKLVRDAKVPFVVQVNGKVRATLELEVGSEQSEVSKLAQSDSNVKKHLDGKKTVKEIFVPDKLINFVVK